MGIKMNKEQILEQSRREHKDQDLYEEEVLKSASNLAAISASVLAVIFFVVQLIVGLGRNYGLFAIVFSILASVFVVKAIKRKKKHEIFVAVMYILLTLGASAAHIYTLIQSSSIL